MFTGITALLLMFIFGNSAADGETSGELSLLVTQWLNGIFSKLELPLELSHQFVRKLAHFTEYSLLGASLTGTVWSWSNRTWRMSTVWMPVLCGTITASLDEWLQTFTPDRCGCFSDVLLDAAGVLWASFALSAILLLIQRSHSEIESD